MWNVDNMVRFACHIEKEKGACYVLYLTIGHNTVLPGRYIVRTGALFTFREVM